MKQLVLKCRRLPMVLLTLVTLVMLLGACNTDTVYHRYEDIPEEGFAKYDSLVFVSDTISVEGEYEVLLCVRSDEEYPYRYLVLKTHIKASQGSETQAVLRCELRGEEGKNTGSGIVHSTNEYRVATLQMHPGDSIRMTVSHNMKRDMLPGLMAIGCRVNKIK